ncbi:hypothetical protein [Acinetobacter haemolyticus]|uniref:hypothetical protein n=1 Tax=Acinetobacter haemolyticus TaxID=29430 RepID=UPI00148A1809|nr:hypothetical protein [Acinetobacter haemolyticus]
MNHLESLIAEYYDWKGYLVKKNLKVGKLSHGGWEMELDIIAFNPITQHLIHIEPSIDAYSWEIRESRFKKKFESGEKYMFSNVFPWLDENTPVERIIVLPAHSAGRDYLCGAKIFSLDEFMLKISVHDKFHRALVLSGFFFLKIASTFLNSSFFPKPIKRRIAI